MRESLKSQMRDLFLPRTRTRPAPTSTELNNLLEQYTLACWMGDAARAERGYSDNCLGRLSGSK